MAELSRQEEIHLYNLSLIPAGAIAALFYASLVYLLHNNGLKTIWETMLFIVPFWMLILSTIFFTFEVLYSRRTQTPLKSHAKRFVGRMSLLGISMLSFLAYFAIAYPVLSPFIGDYAILYGGLIWLIILLVVYLAFRQEVDDLTEGRW